jgi:cell division protein FtsI/penicillin-binding protein 2
MNSRTLTRKPGHSSDAIRDRMHWLKIAFGLVFLTIILRLGYWQIWKHNELASAAVNQYESSERVASVRGQILDNNGRILVGNREAYTLFVQPKVLADNPHEVADRLAPIIATGLEKTPLQATDSAWLREQEQSIRERLIVQLGDEQKKWLALAHGLSREQRAQIETLNIRGLGFDTHFIRYYPDASLSAHLLGFVGKTDIGEDQGYFGLEGFYDLELRGRGGVIHQQQTALGLPLLIGRQDKVNETEGSDLQLTLDRQLQAIIEAKLITGLERYGAVSGEVLVMNPKTGAILAMASFPNYDPSRFIRFPTQYYRNPSVSDLYEPGSTFKVVTVAAGIENGVITPDTTCDDCDGPRVINNYTIRTWNEVYNPNISMRDALAKSDNTAMVFVQEKLGKEHFLESLRQFGLNEKTGIDLQGESDFPFRENDQWRTIDAATASFGQGISTTSIQLLRSVAVIANGGKLLRPYVVQFVRRGNEVVETQPKVIRQVISPATAKTVTEMMVYTAHQGDAKWTVPEGLSVAGKTGTAQIPGDGGYLEDKTIASFVGFAPAEDPEFVMLVKLREPTSSPWGSETAAPLWFEILPYLMK